MSLKHVGVSVVDDKPQEIVFFSLHVCCLACCPCALCCVLCCVLRGMLPLCAALYAAIYAALYRAMYLRLMLHFICQRLDLGLGILPENKRQFELKVTSFFQPID